MVALENAIGLAPEVGCCGHGSEVMAPIMNRADVAYIALRLDNFTCRFAELFLEILITPSIGFVEEIDIMMHAPFDALLTSGGRATHSAIRGTTEGRHRACRSGLCDDGFSFGGCFARMRKNGLCGRGRSQCSIRNCGGRGCCNSRCLAHNLVDMKRLILVPSIMSGVKHETIAALVRVDLAVLNRLAKGAVETLLLALIQSLFQ